MTATNKYLLGAVVLLLLGVAVIVVLATRASVQAKAPTPYRILEPAHIVYLKDDRTDLCFAQLPSLQTGGLNTPSTVLVPCGNLAGILKLK